MHLVKFISIPIVRSIKTWQDPLKLVNLKIIRGVDQCIGSTRSQIGVEEESFFTHLNLLKSLGQLLFKEKSTPQSWIFTLFWF